jgi:single-stranded-DNA-specific exonuclease
MGFFLKVAGVTFDNRQKAISRLSSGQKLNFVREPNNPFDKYAVAVRTESGEPLGYVPSASNGSIAFRMDKGGYYKVTVSTVTGGGIGQSYGLNIYIEEI